MELKKSKEPYKEDTQGYQDLAEVWQDVVSKRHLTISVGLGISLGLACYFLGLFLLKNLNPELKIDLARGYALFFGVGGCIIAAFIAGYFFKPKRILLETATSEDQILEALREEKISVSDELEALKTLPNVIKRELEDVQVYGKLIEILEKELQKTVEQGGSKWK